MGGAPANSLCVCFWLFAWCGGGCKVASPIGGLNAQSAAAHGGDGGQVKSTWCGPPVKLANLSPGYLSHAARC